MDPDRNVMQELGIGASVARMATPFMGKTCFGHFGHFDICQYAPEYRLICIYNIKCLGIFMEIVYISLGIFMETETGTGTETGTETETGTGTGTDTETETE